MTPEKKEVWDVRAKELERVPSSRRRPPTARMVASAVGTAAEMVGHIEPGVEICGVTNGQFSLIDILEHVLSEIGPADVLVSTWTMGMYDGERAEAFCANGRIKSIRWMVDPSMFGRRPELAGRIVKAFGVEAFRAVNNHAKFATLVGEDLQVCVRSSMNLNPNRRLENFDITEGPQLVGFFNALADDIFGRFPAGGGTRTQSRLFFADILATFEAFERVVEVAKEGLEAGMEVDMGALMGVEMNEE